MSCLMTCIIIDKDRRLKILNISDTYWWLTNDKNSIRLFFTFFANNCSGSPNHAAINGADKAEGRSGCHIKSVCQ